MTKRTSRGIVLTYHCPLSATAGSKQYYLVFDDCYLADNVQSHVVLTCLGCRHQVLRGAQLCLTTLLCVPFDSIVAV